VSWPSLTSQSRFTTYTILDCAASAVAWTSTLQQHHYPVHPAGCLRLTRPSQVRRRRACKSWNPRWPRACGGNSGFHPAFDRLLLATAGSANTLKATGVPRCIQTPDTHTHPRFHHTSASRRVLWIPAATRVDLSVH
jgi:hypothetical protein